MQHMTWRYQLVYHDEAKIPYYGLHEVYYMGNELESFTEYPDLVSDSEEGMLHVLDLIREDITKHKPVSYRDLSDKVVGIE